MFQFFLIEITNMKTLCDPLIRKSTRLVQQIHVHHGAAHAVTEGKNQTCVFLSLLRLYFHLNEGFLNTSYHNNGYSYIVILDLYLCFCTLRAEFLRSP